MERGRWFRAGRHCFLQVVLWLLVTAIGCLSLSAGAHATTWGIANNNLDEYYHATPSDYVYQQFTHNAAIGAASYQRFLVPWEVAGTDAPGAANADSQGCVNANSYADNSTSQDPEGLGYGNGSLSGLINALSTAEQQGFTPVIALDNDNGSLDTKGGANGYSWPTQAQTPTQPNDWDMFCAAKMLAEDLGSGGRNVLPAGSYFESYNEPDNHGLTGADCGVTDPADCAARYFADVVSGLAWGGFSSYSSHVIAGTFSTVATAAFSTSQTCANQAGFDARYICYIERGDGHGGIPPDGWATIGADDNPLSSYESYVDNWAFHDYGDLGNSSACGPGGGGCVTTVVQNMLDLMSNSSAPSPGSVWMTETGCRDPGTTGNYCRNWSSTQSGNEAYDWLGIKADFNLTAIFWYSYDSNDDPYFDAGLEDLSSAARAAECEIGTGGLSGTSWSGSWGSINCTGH